MAVPPLAPQGNPFYILAYEVPAVDPAGRMKYLPDLRIAGQTKTRL